jgi:hypothetical protein
VRKTYWSAKQNSGLTTGWKTGRVGPATARTCKRRLRAAAALLLWAAASGEARCQLGAEPPQTLVRQVMTNELQTQQNDDTYWMYVSEVQEPERTRTQHVIETKEGALTLLAAENGHALTPQQQQQEAKRINSLIHNTGELRKQKREHERDAQKEQQLLKMLPEGFLYKYEADEGRNIRLSFRPNPKFRPPTREAKVTKTRTSL